jgi:hypothetical protein
MVEPPGASSAMIRSQPSDHGGPDIPGPDFLKGKAPREPSVASALSRKLR